MKLGKHSLCLVFMHLGMLTLRFGGLSQQDRSSSTDGAKSLPTYKNTVLKRSNNNTNIMQWIAEQALEGNSYITVIRAALLKPV